MGILSVGWLDAAVESVGVDMKHAVDRCLTALSVICYPCDPCVASRQLISTILSLSLSLSLPLSPSCGVTSFTEFAGGLLELLPASCMCGFDMKGITS